MPTTLIDVLHGRVSSVLALMVTIYLTLNSHVIQAEESRSWQPKANEASVVVAGNKRFTILTTGLIRMEYSPSGVFNDSATTVIVNRNLAPPSFELDDTSDVLTITTKAIKLSYRKTLHPFDAENLTAAISAQSDSTSWFYGKVDTQNLGGTARTLDGMNGGIDWNGNPLDLGSGILSRSGWSFIDDSESHRLISEHPDDWPWIETPYSDSIEQQGYQDGYLFAYGTNYKQALKDFTHIAGKIPIPPKYAFGYWWSRYWVYSDAELEQLMKQMRNYDIPIDVLIIDMDWHLTHGGLKDIKNPQLDPLGELLGWTGYTWNKALFPDPSAFLQWTESFNLKTALNLHPASGIPPMEAQYQAFADHYGFETSKQEYIPYRMAEKAWAEAYVETILRPLERQGVDFWWLDWQQFRESKVMPQLSNTWWLNYVFYTDMQRQGKRPLLFHRWGGLGNHRYQIGFSGDDKISWESLNYQSYFTATASNVGYGYWSHDIGGHGSGDLDSDPELYLRWLQFGVFSPIFRTHSAKISTIERRFWKYPDHFEPMRDMVKLRYALHPYIYKTARQAFDSGVSIVRPMYYDFPSSQQAYDYKHQYMFGDDLLVAPVDSPVDPNTGLATKDIWLPQGEWYEWFTGTSIRGGQTLVRQYTSTEIPVFAKAGAIIPMYKDVKHLQDQINHITLRFIPGQSGQTRLYEDSGEDLGYQGNQFSTTEVTQEITEAGHKRIIIAARKGIYEGQEETRQFDLLLPATLPIQSVTVNGKHLEPEQIIYHGAELANRIRLPQSKSSDALDILIVGDFASSNELNAKLGAFKRLSQAVADLKIEVARENWWASLPDNMLLLEQTPRLIQRNPAKTKELIRYFNTHYSSLTEAIETHKDIRPHMMSKYKAFLGLPTKSTGQKP